MRSKWAAEKKRAISMRRHGASIRDIEGRLGIRKSTLSGWFRYVKISDYHKKRLQKRFDQALIKARVEAIKWHNGQKAERMLQAQSDAVSSLGKVNIHQTEIIELALAMLYLGEGSKRNTQTALGNSDPMILRFFIQSMQILYGVPPSACTCHLHLRADQDPEKMKRFWSRILGVPKANFRKTLIDKRTVGSATYPRYKGVCAVGYSRVAIQRKLMYIANAFCDEITKRVRA